MDGPVAYIDFNRFSIANISITAQPIAVKFAQKKSQKSELSSGSLTAPVRDPIAEKIAQL